MSKTVMDIVREHEGEQDYRWYLSMGMDFIETLREVKKSGSPGEEEDLATALVDLLLDCHPTLGIALIHIMSRDNYISINSILSADDPRRGQMGRKYREFAKAAMLS